MANPAVDTIFAADPSARVFNDRLYVYVSYDEPYTNTHDSMLGYHCLSTDDLVNWVDHGRILHLENVEWAISHMWAIDCVFWQGKYYLTYCAIERATSTFRTGIATSDRPEGPFVDQGVVAGVEWGQDPGVLIENGIPYLSWGARGSIFIAELNRDLMSVKPETIKNLSESFSGYEGPFLHKYNDKFYITFPALDNEVWPQRMCYAVADNPLGPYQDKGVFIDVYEGNSGTIHGSVVEFKGQWYAFYHSAWVSGMATSRSMMIDKLEYTADGDIVPIIPSRDGAVAGPTHTISVLDAAAAGVVAGKLNGTRVETDSSDFTGHGYVTGLVQQEYGVSVVAEFGCERDYEVVVRYRNHGKDFNARVLFGTHLFFDGIQNQSYEQYINRGTVFPNTNGNWQELTIGTVRVQPREYTVRLSASHNLPAGEPAIDIDCFILIPR